MNTNILWTEKKLQKWDGESSGDVQTPNDMEQLSIIETGAKLKMIESCLEDALKSFKQATIINDGFESSNKLLEDSLKNVKETRLKLEKNVWHMFGGPKGHKF